MKLKALLLIPLMMVLAGCNNSSNVISNQETVDKVKEILNKQDLSEFYTKTIRGVYSLEYDVLDIDNDFDLSDTDYVEGSKTTSYLNYTGSGLFGFYYNLSKDEYNSIVDDKNNIAIFDAISKGKGYYGLALSGRTMSFKREASYEAKIHNLDILQSVTLKSNDEDVWVDNSLYVSDTGIFQSDSNQSINAIINKELLFSSVSTRSFREIFSKVDLFDTPSNIEHLDKLYFSICRELVNKNDKEISDFILKNQISIKEEDNIELSFVFSNDDIEEAEMDYIFPGAIKGTLKFDKTTYEFLNFNYEMPYKTETYDENTGSIKLVNTKFVCNGSSSRTLPHDEIEPIDPVVYDDVAEFLKDVEEEVVPPNIEL